MPVSKCGSPFARHATIASTLGCPGRAMELREVLGSRSKWITGRRGKLRLSAGWAIAETFFDDLRPLFVKIFHADVVDRLACLFTHDTGLLRMFDNPDKFFVNRVRVA